jgi:hypothetical protein
VRAEVSPGMAQPSIGVSRRASVLALKKVTVKHLFKSLIFMLQLAQSVN